MSSARPRGRVELHLCQLQRWRSDGRMDFLGVQLLKPTSVLSWPTTAAVVSVTTTPGAVAPGSSCFPTPTSYTTAGLFQHDNAQRINDVATQVAGYYTAGPAPTPVPLTPVPPTPVPLLLPRTTATRRTRQLTTSASMVPPRTTARSTAVATGARHTTRPNAAAVPLRHRSRPQRRLLAPATALGSRATRRVDATTVVRPRAGGPARASRLIEYG